MIAPAQSLVIVGSGLAAWTLVREFRKLDAQTPITLITRDNGDFYSKPMLSNALSSGKTAAQLVSATSAAMAHQLGVTVMAKTDVTAIDPVACSVTTALGPVTYSRLVLALGADPVRLPLQGDAADRVISVNDLQDYATFPVAFVHLVSTPASEVARASRIKCRLHPLHEFLILGHVTDLDVENHICAHLKLLM